MKRCGTYTMKDIAELLGQSVEATRKWLQREGLAATDFKGIVRAMAAEERHAWDNNWWSDRWNAKVRFLIPAEVEELAEEYKAMMERGEMPENWVDLDKADRPEKGGYSDGGNNARPGVWRAHSKGIAYIDVMRRIEREQRVFIREARQSRQAVAVR